MVGCTQIVVRFFLGSAEFSEDKLSSDLYSSSFWLAKPPNEDLDFGGELWKEVESR